MSCSALMAPPLLGTQLLWLPLFLVLTQGGPTHNATRGERRGRFVRRGPLTEATPPQLRCTAAKGSWCTTFLEQQPVPWKAPPRGSKSCPVACNTVGNCNADTGLCECPAGWTGRDCGTVQKRPCTVRHRRPKDSSDVPLSHIGPDKRDTDWSNQEDTQSRCAGFCDDDIASCWCDRGPYARIEAPVGSTPGTPPLRRGRPLAVRPAADAKGNELLWGVPDVTYASLFGPKGWCMVPEPEKEYGCMIDGLAGKYCDVVTEHFCVGQCSGHGTCYLGFCKCDMGYYGHDCSRPIAGTPPLPGRIPTTPHLKHVVNEPPAAQDPPPAPTRKRPLIYVYDLEPLYSAKLLQYRVASSWCVHRRYHNEDNETLHMGVWGYAVDTLLHELINMSPHRTFDPEEADFFYVPQYSSCFPFPIMGWADFPWFHVPGVDIRPMHMSNMVLDVKRWIDETYPFWQRRGGRDHIFTFTHDEGACWAPNEVTPATWLLHWGRKDLHHVSGSAFLPDNYSQEHVSWRQPHGWLKNTQGHACYRPDKDLVIPSLREPEKYRQSPLLGVPSQERDILLFFRGEVGENRLSHYSRGIRQRIYKTAKAQDWRKKHNVLIGHGGDILGDYSSLLARAKFCLVMPGDGWSGRCEDCVLHGAIPVVIMDDVDTVYESILDYDTFAVRIREDQVPQTLDILLAIPDKRVRAMQAHLGRVWHRFRYAQGPALALDAKRRLREAPADPAASRAVFGDPSRPALSRLPKPFQGDPTIDDAFSTIMQWLHYRIPFTR